MRQRKRRTPHKCVVMSLDTTHLCAQQKCSFYTFKGRMKTNKHKNLRWQLLMYYFVCCVRATFSVAQCYSFLLFFFFFQLMGIMFCPGQWWHEYAWITANWGYKEIYRKYKICSIKHYVADTRIFTFAFATFCKHTRAHNMHIRLVWKMGITIPRMGLTIQNIDFAILNLFLLISV